MVIYNEGSLIDFSSNFFFNFNSTVRITMITVVTYIYIYINHYYFISGGIPYGSVTGMIAKYPEFTRQQFNSIQARQLSRFRNEVPLIVNSNFRATTLVDTRSQSVQIYKDRSGVLGSINYIEYYAPLDTKS